MKREQMNRVMSGVGGAIGNKRFGQFMSKEQMEELAKEIKDLKTEILARSE